MTDDIEMTDTHHTHTGTQSPYEPELASFEYERGAEDSAVAKTGTTTVGISTDDGVVIGTDRRASLGGRFVSNKNVVKVEQVHPTAALTLVGSVGGAQSFIRTLRSEASLYETRRDQPMSIHALATLAGNFARGGPFIAINPILGGVDEEGSHVYSIDPAGGVMEDDYTVTGSGMQLAHGALEGEYDPTLSLEAAASLAARAVQAASERDTGSGNGLVVATVTEDGVDVDEYDDAAELL
ncbi:archaeal proteasome endopeptidase complex subunit beta [Halovenus marina]|uniref:archaeal proteasome endopeptidase complex subunit beta n=1 Tax=Halovenus marina TaxID=3396621 RepID=UPI003F55E9F2